MEDRTKLKWYQKPTGVIILLIFFFPLGLYLLWKNDIWTKQTRWFITAIIFVVIVANVGNDKSSNSGSKSSTENIEGTKSCLVGFDWVYPSSSNPTGAWKFSSDGTVSFSTTMFGGFTKRGNWQVNSPGQVKISYTSSTQGSIPDDQILTMSSCSSLEVGSTVYSKN